MKSLLSLLLAVAFLGSLEAINSSSSDHDESILDPFNDPEAAQTTFVPHGLFHDTEDFSRS